MNGCDRLDARPAGGDIGTISSGVLHEPYPITLSHRRQMAGPKSRLSHKALFKYIHNQSHLRYWLCQYIIIICKEKALPYFRL